MRDINTGGPAFPTDIEHQNGSNNYHYEGMTLRDYFAAKAMQEWVGVFDAEEGAKRAYEWADAMLRAREK